MKNQLLFLVLMMMPLVASEHDIEVQNGDGVTIYYNYTNDGTELEVTFRGEIYDTYSNEYTGNVVIPEEVTYMNKNHKVTSIGCNAFSYCFDLISVTIPNSVKIIDELAFLWCTGLTSITIPNSVTSIGDEAFAVCSELSSITIPNSVTSIGEEAFCGCSNFTSITIPNSVTRIDDGTFRGCSGLTSITIPNSVTSIGVQAFYFCESLTSVNIPNSVTSIGQSAFEDCSSLTSVTIPNSVTSIGSSAFRGCSGLTSVTIGNSVTSIGLLAFYGADISIVISLIENPFRIYGKIFNSRTFSKNTFNNATLYVPTGTIEKYKGADGWKDFAFIEEGIPAGINAVENTKSNNTAIYDLNGVRQPELKKGVNIINGKKVVRK